jgi:hypothetical protein
MAEVRRMTDRERPSFVRVRAEARRNRAVDLAVDLRAAGRSPAAAEADHRTRLAAGVGRPLVRPSARPSLVADHRSHLAAAVLRSLHLEVQAERRNQAAVHPWVVRAVLRNHRAADHPVAVRAVLRNQTAERQAAERRSLPAEDREALRIHQPEDQVVLRAVAVVVLRIRPRVAVLRTRRALAVAHREDPVAAACRPWRSWSCRRQLALRPRGSPSASSPFGRSRSRDRPRARTRGHAGRCRRSRWCCRDP